MLDNGIVVIVFLFIVGVLLIVEFGVLLDVLFVVIVIGVLIGWLCCIFGDVDLDKLWELWD